MLCCAELREGKAVSDCSCSHVLRLVNLTLFCVTNISTEVDVSLLARMSLLKYFLIFEVKTSLTAFGRGKKSMSWRHHDAIARTSTRKKCRRP